MLIEVELPNIPGYNYTGEYREPNIDEYYLKGRKVTLHGQENFPASCVGSHIIMEKVHTSKPEPPYLFKYGWVAKDLHGEWYWYSVKPLYSTSTNEWWSDEDNDYSYVMRFDPIDIGWTEPKIRWDKSLMECGV